ncbi:DUF6011 domain-containing protein [Streptomyces sp. NPDC087769]|uniref:DUF6011 domain-containing protein n=1 Tax=Streptomyces sp. NPDC087769 TaxID=3365802 RepID=UPI0038236D52
MTPTCRVCGRLLRSEKWAARRIGPVCWSRTHGRTGPPPTTHGEPEIYPGQTEIPLPPMQHELTWST